MIHIGMKKRKATRGDGIGARQSECVHDSCPSTRLNSFSYIFRNLRTVQLEKKGKKNFQVRRFPAFRHRGRRVEVLQDRSAETDVHHRHQAYRRRTLNTPWLTDYIHIKGDIAAKIS